MVKFTEYRMLLVAIMIIASVAAVSGLRCYFCIQKSKATFNQHGLQIKSEIPDDLPHSNFPNHPTCVFEKEPDNALSVDCNDESFVNEFLPENETVQAKFAKLDYDIDALMNASVEQRFSCLTIYATQEPTLEDGVTTQLQFTVRSCLRSHLDLTLELRYLDSHLARLDNVTGYLCDMANNCNGKGDTMSYKSSVTLTPE